MVAEQQRVLQAELFPAIEAEGIVIRAAKDLMPAERQQIAELFRREIFPVLTPLAIDPGHPFPHLQNKSLNLVTVMQRPHHTDKLFAVVQVPALLPRFVQLAGDKGHAFVTLETVIRLHLADLFPGTVLEPASVFRVTRDSEYEIGDDEVEDLLKAIEEEVRKRRRGNAVRLEIEADAPAEVEQFLVHALDLEQQDVYRIDGMSDLTGLFQIYSLPGYPQLRDPQAIPQAVPEFSQALTPFHAIRSRDILVHHPYESFTHVVDFVEAAAVDDKVLAIKQSLYRTSSDSPIVKALQRAADNGKQVTAVIELKARLDEERNILWARELEKSGVHVVFGFVGLKTHCKIALVVRREDDGIRRYVHMATGNYNPQTARIYTDLGFFTCNSEFAEDASALFNYLTGYGELPQWRKLVVAPSRMQDCMLELFAREAKHQQAGKESRIIAKLNGLLEPKIVQGLYRASQAGVPIDIVCRGICALRPGLPGISDSIRVRSIVDRFLEHSRIYYFHNAGNPEVYIGSADWMDRNLSRRVEVVWPVEQPDLKQRLIQEVLAISLADNVKARELSSDGTWRRVKSADAAVRVRSQERFLELALANSQRRQATPPPPPPSINGEAQPTRRTRRRTRQSG
jgi:polyphosphate kinase